MHTSGSFLISTAGSFHRLKERRWEKFEYKLVNRVFMVFIADVRCGIYSILFFFFFYMECCSFFCEVMIMTG